MRKLVYLLVIGGLAYVVIFRLPAETKRQALAAVGLADFFSQSLPNFLREKLSIPENPVAKRQKLLDELSQAIGTVERELEAVVPPRLDGAPLKLPSPQDIREHIQEAREFLSKSEEVLRDLGDVNPKSGLFSKISERLLDKVLPPEAVPAGEDGVGGDAGAAAVCRCP